MDVSARNLALAIKASQLVLEDKRNDTDRFRSLLFELVHESEVADHPFPLVNGRQVRSTLLVVAVTSHFMIEHRIMVMMPLHEEAPPSAWGKIPGQQIVLSLVHVRKLLFFVDRHVPENAEDDTRIRFEYCDRGFAVSVEDQDGSSNGMACPHRDCDRLPAAAFPGNWRKAIPEAAFSSAENPMPYAIDPEILGVLLNVCHALKVTSNVPFQRGYVLFRSAGRLSPIECAIRHGRTGLPLKEISSRMILMPMRTDETDGEIVSGDKALVPEQTEPRFQPFPKAESAPEEV